MSTITTEETFNYTVDSKGGNKYIVTSSDGEKREIDLDGITIVGEEDYKRMQEEGICMDLYLTQQDHDGDPFWQAAAEYAMN